MLASLPQPPLIADGLRLHLSVLLLLPHPGPLVTALLAGAGPRPASPGALAHTTLQHLRDSLKEDMTTEEVLQTLVDATEFAQLPVRHNEDNINSELAK